MVLFGGAAPNPYSREGQDGPFPILNQEVIPVTNNVLTIRFMVKPAISAPNMRTLGNAKVHAGCFVRPWGMFMVAAWGMFMVAAWSFKRTPDRAYTLTSDPVTCLDCLTRLSKAGLPREGVTVPAEVTEVRFRLAVELEDRVLIPYPVPWLLPLATRPRPCWFEEIRREHRQLKGFVKRATPADAEEVSGLIGLGVEKLAALFGELDGDGGQQAAA